MSRKFLYMSDAHIKQRTWTNNTQIQFDAYYALKKLTNKLITLPEDKRPDTLVIGGDWFDSNKPSALDVYTSFEFLRQFKHVYMIKGNHDCASPHFLECDRHSNSGQGNIPELHTLTSLTPAGTVLADSSSMIAGIDWTASSDELERGLSDIANLSVSGVPLFVVLHASFLHLLGFETVCQLSLDDIDAIFGDRKVFVLAGDIHVRNTMPLASGGYVHSAGSLYPLSWDRTADRCAVSLVDMDTGEIDDIWCDVRSYVNVQVDDCSADAACDALDRALAGTETLELPTVARIVSPGPLEAIPSREGVLVQSHVSGGPELPMEGAAASASQDYTMDMAVRDTLSFDEDLAELAVALLHSSDPLVEIDGWLDYWEVVRAQPSQ